jgi:hypothetical protein
MNIGIPVLGRGLARPRITGARRGAAGAFLAIAVWG